VTSNTNVWAADGINTSNSGGGLFAENTSTGNSYNALEGISAYTGTTYVPSGVFGLHINSSGAGYGGSFTTNSSNGGSYGLYAQMPTGSAGYAAYYGGDINVTGTYYNISDGSLKENIHSAAQMMDKLERIDVSSYRLQGVISGQNYGVAQGTSSRSAGAGGRVGIPAAGQKPHISCRRCRVPAKMPYLKTQKRSKL
jgi:hypothetical protein